MFVIQVIIIITRHAITVHACTHERTRNGKVSEGNQKALCSKNSFRIINGMKIYGNYDLKRHALCTGRKTDCIKY